MLPEPHNSVEVFYSYAHEDEKLRDKLKKHLSNLKRQGVITDWYDRDISAGKEWDEEINQHLNSAKVILLLISPDFMDSDYIHEVEVNRAMERHESREARVIPIILRPVDWQGAPFSKLQSLPSDVRPVTLWKNQDEAFLDVTNGIRVAIQDLSDPSVSIPRGLDIPGPPKVGFVSRRDKDNRDIVERLHKELAPQINQLVVLWGAGGVGKTAIAAEAVRGLIQPFAKRVVWVSADGLDAFSLATLLDGIAHQLGQADLRKLSFELKRERVRDLVKTAPTLVVLDNFETIESAERARCADWLGKPAPCSALITTRDLIEEARNIPIETMQPQEAKDLLEHLITQAHDSRAFAKLDRDRLIQTAEANPLVLQWLVGQIDLAQDPDEVLEDLRHGEGTAAERVFKRTFELRQLDNGGRAVLLALSLFAPSATRRAAADVSGLGKESDKRKFKNAVRSLSALWFIHTADESKRLAVEGLTRELTKARLDTDPRAKTFYPRFVSRFVRLAEANQQSTGKDFDALELEKDNLLTATDVAFNQGDGRSVFRLSHVLAFPDQGMLEVRGYWDEALRIGELALKIARSLQIREEIANWALNVAIMAQSRGEASYARNLYEESLEIGHQLGNESVTAGALHNLGDLAHDEGKMEEARRLLEASLAIKRKLGRFGDAAGTLHHLGWLAQEEGKHEEARQLYNESLEIENRLGDQFGIAKTLHHLGWLAQDEGKFGEARRLYEKSLQIKEKLGNQLGIATTWHQLGQLHISEGEYDKADGLLQQSLTILKRLGDKANTAECLESLGRLRVAQRRLADADSLFDEALGIADTLRNPFRIASVKHSLGLLAEEQSDRKRARQLLLEACAILEMLGLPKIKDARRDLERVEAKAVLEERIN
jgi:tetratricopeptide (TPR) repeat protein